jgi:NAD(P)-dependent dehydrogenase (short-subunit alcohol dehydrogenase family)
LPSTAAIEIARRRRARERARGGTRRLTTRAHVHYYIVYNTSRRTSGVENTSLLAASPSSPECLGTDSGGRLFAGAHGAVIATRRARPRRAGSPARRRHGDVGDEAVVARHAGTAPTLRPLTCCSYRRRVHGKSVADSTLDEWNFVLRTNLTGPPVGARRCPPWRRAAAVRSSSSQLATAGGRSNAAYIA